MKKILFFFFIFLLIPCVQVHAAKNPYSHYETLEETEEKIVSCTWYAWQEAHNRAKVDLPSFGSAKNWYDKASSYGYAVGSTPKANSIAVYSGGTNGHVAYVMTVEDTSMTVNEAGIYIYEKEYDEAGNVISSKKVPYNKTGIYVGNTSTKEVGKHRDEDDLSSVILIGFIYLDQSPTTKTTTETTTTTTTTTITTTTQSSTVSTTTTELSKPTETTTIKPNVEETEEEQKLDKSKYTYIMLMDIAFVIITICIIYLVRQ